MADEIKTSLNIGKNLVSSSVASKIKPIQSNLNKPKTESIYASISVVDNSLILNMDDTNELLLSEIDMQTENIGGALKMPNGGISDVIVNGKSAIKNNTAYITVPTKISDLPNDAKYTADAETGNYLRLTEENNLVTIRLYSVVGYELSAISFYKNVYYPGVCISIDSNKRINLLFDKSVLRLNDKGELTINTELIATKEDLKKKQNNLRATNGLELNNDTNEIKTLFDIHDRELEY